MGKFDGFLICADLDDTFRCGEESIRVHSEAVQYFTRNGGKFTFATGRPVAYLRNQPFFHIINAPACLYNGAYIYDYAIERPLRQVHMGFTVGQFIEQVDSLLYEKARMYIPPNGKDPDYFTPGSQIQQLPQEAMDCKPLKMVFSFGSEPEAEVFRDAAKTQSLLKDCYVSRSWDVGVEITAGNATKGHGIQFIKQHLGNIHTAIGVGNYENDVPLLEYADIGIAVDNALDCVKCAADRIVRSASEFGLQELIQTI